VSVKDPGSLEKTKKFFFLVSHFVSLSSSPGSVLIDDSGGEDV
jgi:hypothetical protein